jgi:DNA repair exonuclease SbcCD ATPase subunit
MSELAQYRLIADDANARRRSALDAVANEKKALEAAIADYDDRKTVQQILQSLAAGVQESAHAQIARIVSRCLQTVYGNETYEFRIKFERKRGKTDAVLTFVRDGHEIDDPLNAAGGGVVAVASFGLRLAALVLSRPQPRKLIVSDEPFAGLDKHALRRMAQLIETLSSELGFQFVFVTHNRELMMGRVIELGGD